MTTSSPAMFVREARPRMPAVVLVALGVLLVAITIVSAAGEAATIYGLKSFASSLSSGPPTRLFSFEDDGTGFRSIGDVTLGGALIDADGLAVSRISGLRAFQVGGGLLSINATTAVATALSGPYAGRDIRGAMFDRSDNLWALDAANNSLLKVNPTTGAILSETTLAIDLHDGTDLAQAADGTVYLVNHDLTINPPFGRPRVYTLDLASGALTLVFTDLANDPAFPSVPVFFPGLAAGSGLSAPTLFGYDANGFEDIFSYALPTFARSPVILNFIPEFNAGRGDLASYPPPNLPTGSGRFSISVVCPSTARRGSTVPTTVTFKNSTATARTVTRGAVVFHAGQLTFLGPQAFAVDPTIPVPSGTIATPSVASHDFSFLIPAQARSGSFVTIAFNFLGQVGANPQRKGLAGAACEVEIQR